MIKELLNLHYLMETTKFDKNDNSRTWENRWYKYWSKRKSETVKKVLSNASIKAKLKVVKIDSETKEVIKRSNIKFKIFDVTNNKYVCQTVTYPISITYCEFETNEDGEFTTPHPLKTGTYRLEEIDQVIDGYLWNSVSHEFIIDEDSNLRTDSEFGIIFDTFFENKQVKGEIKIIKFEVVGLLKKVLFIQK